MIKRLRIKFVCITMGIVTVMLCVVFGMVIFFTHSGMEQESVQMLQRIAGEIRIPGKPGLHGEDVRLPYFIVEVGTRGEILASGEGYFDLSDEDALRELISLCQEAGTDTGVLREPCLRFCRRETPMGQRFVFADISSEEAALGNLVRSCLLIGILSFLALLGISILLARWATAPVADAWQKQRQFTADASHELKTPLTVILTNAELLQNPEYDAQSRTQFVSNILSMSRQMRNLAESLLDLARADSGNMVFSLVDLSTLTEDAVLPFEPVYFEKGLTLESHIEAGILVRGSASHLRQVVDILLDNAAKYTDASGIVTVALARQGRGCLLSVTNPGKPLSREELKSIFRRFYRADKARSMTGSFGLGLPIAQAILEQHKGKIWAASSGGRNTFFVQLPEAKKK